MGVKLYVYVGPYAKYKYTGKRPDIYELCEYRENLTEISVDEKNKIVYVMANKGRSFQISDECNPTSVTQEKMSDDLEWFKSTFAEDLSVLEKELGNAPVVEWGYYAVWW